MYEQEVRGFPCYPAVKFLPADWGWNLLPHMILFKLRKDGFVQSVKMGQPVELTDIGRKLVRDHLATVEVAQSV
jgi:hypothetical protein